MTRYGVHERDLPVDVAELLHDIALLAEDRLPAGWGFVFLAATLGDGGDLGYVSDCDRGDVVRMMTEFSERFS